MKNSIYVSGIGAGKESFAKKLKEWGYRLADRQEDSSASLPYMTQEYVIYGRDELETILQGSLVIPVYDRDFDSILNDMPRDLNKRLKDLPSLFMGMEMPIERQMERWLPLALCKVEDCLTGYEMYLVGEHAKRRDLLEKAACMGEKRAMEWMAQDCQEKGDWKEAERWLKEQKDPISLRKLAQHALVKHRYSEAIGLYEELVEDGDAVAAFHLGMLYKQGKGVAKDKEKALRLLKLAAEAGLPRAKKELP